VTGLRHGLAVLSLLLLWLYDMRPVKNLTTYPTFSTGTSGGRNNTIPRDM